MFNPIVILPPFGVRCLRPSFPWNQMQIVSRHYYLNTGHTRISQWLLPAQAGDSRGDVGLAGAGGPGGPFQHAGFPAIPTQRDAVIPSSAHGWRPTSRKLGPIAVCPSRITNTLKALNYWNASIRKSNAARWVRIFSDEASCMRLIRAVAAEQH